MAGNARVRREKLLEAAEGYLTLEMPDHALRELKAVEDPEKCRLRWNRLRGESLRQKGEFEEALQAYNRALAEKPADVEILMGMAWCYKRTGQLQRAIAATEEAYRASPQEPILLYNLACYYALAGDKPQALSWLGRALRMQRTLRKLIAGEPDFDRLRDDPDFQLMTSAADDVTKAT
jgi:Flp pilus assembly protein TadD